MNAAAKKHKKKRELKPGGGKPSEQLVTKSLADNTYHGIIREGNLGSQFLESSCARYSWASGVKYEGPFVASQIEGRGKFTWPDGSAYEGELLGGKRHGDGSYVSADGTARYDGQWRNGKREGLGRLTYSPDGSSFYEGGWKDGQKHGQGKQLWHSGNLYEGHWELGKMRGLGTMIWKIGPSGGCEQYTGQWENNLPHGEGTHTWLNSIPDRLITAASASRPASAPSPSPVVQVQQQLHNRYTGQWVWGKREGFGKFFYANGAVYEGQWKNHVKQGMGKHTLEDGRVYEGLFEDDRVAGVDQAVSFAGNFNEENPICRCTDLRDIEILAFPLDRKAMPLTTGSGVGYTSTEKIMREVYNLLLRHLGELREIYARYRMFLPGQAEDPYVLTTCQFWIFARDAGLITPSCTLARFDRAIFSGPRQIREANPEDAAEMRPLTPRNPGDRRGSCGDESRSSSELRIAGLVGTRSMMQEASPHSRMETDEASSPASTLPSPGGEWRAHIATLQAAPEDSVAEKEPEQTVEARDKVAPYSLGRKFLRTDAQLKAENVVNVHKPERALLFRHFLESTVRLAVVRFPHERGLEPQVKRLFKEHILPNSSAASKSDELFAFLVQKDIAERLQELEPSLHNVFRRLTLQEPLGKGSASVEEATDSAEASISEAADPLSPCGDLGSQRRRYHIRGKTDKTLRVKDVLRLLDFMGLLKPVVPEVTQSMGQQLADGVDSTRPQPVVRGDDSEGPALDDNEHSDEDEDGSGGSVAADDDVLGILEDKSTKFTKSLPFTGPPARPPRVPMRKITTPESSILNPGLNVIPEASLLKRGLSTPPGGEGKRLDIQDRRVKEDAPTAAVTRSGSTNPEHNAMQAAPQAQGQGQAKRRGDKVIKDGDGGRKGKVATPVQPKVTAADFAPVDHGVTTLEVLQLLSEVLSPAALLQISWETKAGFIAEPLSWHQDDAQPISENLSVLEYAETEIVFAEFVRLLVRMADLGTRTDPNLCKRFSFADRVEGFLRFVFLPSMRTPYTAPAPVPAAAAGTRKMSSSSDGAKSKQGDLGQGAGGAESAKSPEEAAEGADVTQDCDAEKLPVQDAPPPEPKLWRGYEFTGPPGADTPRRWPKSYDAEVMDWE